MHIWEGKERITIDYWKAEDFKFKSKPPKSTKTIQCIQEADIVRYEIRQVLEGLYLPRVVVDGHLTKNQYVDALYARLDAIKHKEGIRRGLGLTRI